MPASEAVIARADKLASTLPPPAVPDTPPVVEPIAVPASITAQSALDPAPVLSPAPERRRGAALILAAIILIAVNLRIGVTSVGALLGELGPALRLSPLMLGVVTALPTAAFAAFGGFTPRLVRRIRPSALLTVAMVLLAIGLVARALADSAAVFVVASATAMAGVAVGNVLLPVLIKRYFSTRVGMVTALYTVAMVLAGTTAAAVSVPLADAAGTWRIGLGLWAIPAVLAVAPVLALWWSRRDSAVSGSGPVIRVGRTGLGWAMAIFFGMQSFSGYAVMGWLPQIYRDAGFSGRQAGLLLAAVIGAGVPVTFAMPWVASRRPDQRPLVIVLAASMLVAYVGLAVAPHSGALLWTGLLAFGQGAFPLALALVGLRSRTAAGTVALSAFAQSAGYLIAVAGPLAVGLLYHATGGWYASLGILIVALLVQAGAGLSAARPRMLEDSVPVPAAV